ncbi:type IV pilus twitching motility protein PilT [Planctomycetales bacterium ZRK34]|nr:type IV pilus twitching motility protein PilT [Planctomycetales bacterium ZRK34]
MKIQVNPHAVTATDPNKLYIPKAAAKPTAAAAAVDDQATFTEGERIPSPVPPGQLDAEAVAYLKKCVEVGASDLHLSAGSPPFMRLNGEIKFFERDPLTPDESLRMALGFMSDEEQQKYLRTHDVDMSYELEGVSRFRVNSLMTFRGADIIFRIIPEHVPTLRDLGVPEDIGKLTDWTQGLVLVTGPAGCGKSTTAAALVDLVNEHRHDHIITVEDPVEYIHPSKNCNVTQRQVPRDTASFATALRGALREDPDVIMIGEMRDLETISLALTAAETGHLVIGTLHTKSAARTVDRIIDVFPTDQQTQIRIMISEALRGIISQVLVPRKDGKGRVAALEILYNNLAISNAIRDAKSFQIPSIMQTGKKLGMQLMDDALAHLVTTGVVDREDAIKVCENPKHIP